MRRYTLTIVSCIAVAVLALTAGSGCKKSEATAAQGRDLFASTCARCHGAVEREVPDKEATSVFHLLRQRPLLIFAGGVLLFQLANAAMLPLMAGAGARRFTQGTTRVELQV